MRRNLYLNIHYHLIVYQDLFYCLLTHEQGVKSVMVTTMGESAKAINLDFKKAIENLQDFQFDIIFLDPPYETDYIETSIKLITKYNLVRNEGIIICESNSLDKIIYDDNYKEIRSKKYGDKYIVILEKIC